MSTTAVGQALSLAPAEIGPALLAVDEDQWFERTSARVSPQALANVEVGMANGDGGTVVVGLANGVVEGTDADRAHRNALQRAHLDLTDPPVRVHSRLVPCVSSAGTADHLLVVEVQPGETVHANQRDEAFLRAGDTNRKLSYLQRTELVYDKGQAVFEASAMPGVRARDLDEDLLVDYARAARHPAPSRLLEARGLARGRSITLAAWLLFGRHPQRLCPEAYVRVVRYRGTERETGSRQAVVEDVRCEGAIPVVLHQAADCVRGLQPARRALGRGGRFERQGLVPEDAWLEGLVNAVVHRSYSLGGDHIRVEIFDDRIEIESPGRFPGLARLDDPLNVTRFARNPRIARVCADLDFGQELGEGIRRIFEEMRLAGLGDPLYHQTSGSVRLVLSSLPVDRELEASLPPRARDVLRVVRRAGQAGRVSTGDVVDATGLSRPLVLRMLRALQAAGLAEWVGHSPKDPRAYWRLPVE